MTDESHIPNRSIAGGETSSPDDVEMLSEVLQHFGMHAWPSYMFGMGAAMITGASMHGLNAQVAAAVNTPKRAADIMRKEGNKADPENQLHKENHRCFAFGTSTNNIKRIKFHPENEFPKGQEKDWPLLILTSNHATARDHDDLSILMHGWERLYHDTFDKDTKTPPTKTVSTLFTEPHRLLNGANLLDRLEFIRNDERRNLKGTAPDAVQLGNMILAMLLKDPTQINLASTESLDAPLRNTQDLPDDIIRKDNTKPLTLRDDAADVAAHIRLAGYSRSGNVATDAMRYVARQLCPTITDKEEGRKSAPPFRIQDKQNKRLRALTEADLQPILQKIPVLATAPWEAPLSDREKELGIRRLTIINEHDKLSYGFFSKHGGMSHYDDKDQCIIVDGLQGKKGHNPREALIGECDEHGTPKHGAHGYIVEDEAAKAALQKFFTINSPHKSREVGA